MRANVKAVLATAILVCMVPIAGFALSPFNTDFESLNASDPNALGNDGWLIFANVWLTGGGYYNYGVFPAPNHEFGFSQIVTGEGGASQGVQQLVVFSDYNNADHANNALIQSIVFQEQIIGPDDVGEVWVFDFQAKRGNIAGSSVAKAFIKTLDPGAGFAETNFIFEDMTSIPDTWGSYRLSIDIDAGLVGQILQTGFLNDATLYEGSGIFYDNLRFWPQTVVPSEPVSWGEVKTLYR